MKQWLCPWKNIPTLAFRHPSALGLYVLWIRSWVQNLVNGFGINVAIHHRIGQWIYRLMYNLQNMEITRSNRLNKQGTHFTAGCSELNFNRVSESWSCRFKSSLQCPESAMLMRLTTAEVTLASYRWFSGSPALTRRNGTLGIEKIKKIHAWTFPHGDSRIKRKWGWLMCGKIN